MWWRRRSELVADRSLVDDAHHLVPAGAGVMRAGKPDGQRLGSAVTLRWSAVNGATEYSVLVGSTPSSSDLLSTNTTNNSYTWTARPGQQYARVQAKCGGQFGGSSNEVVFTVGGSSAD